MPKLIRDLTKESELSVRERVFGAFENEMAFFQTPAQQRSNRWKAGKKQKKQKNENKNKKIHLKLNHF